MFQTGRNWEIWPHFLYCIYFHIQFAMLVGFSTPMLLSPELAELMGETHVSKVIDVPIFGSDHMLITSVK